MAAHWSHLGDVLSAAGAIAFTLASLPIVDLGLNWHELTTRCERYDGWGDMRFFRASNSEVYISSFRMRVLKNDDLYRMAVQTAALNVY